MANQIISGALRIVGALAEKQNPTLDQFNNALETLNALINHMAEVDPGMWRMTWGTQTFTASSAVSNGGKYYRCIRKHTSAATNEPGVGANYTTYWYEDSSVSGSAAAWVTATDYTCSGDFAFTSAFAIAKAFVRYEGTDYPLQLAEFGEFLDTDKDKTEQDVPRLLYFDRLNSYDVHLYPQPDSTIATSAVLHLLYINHMTELADAGDAAYLPPTMLRALKYMLASDLADERGRSTEFCTRITAKAEALWAMCRKGPHSDVSEVKGIKPCF